jgi:hypothetical protein
MEICKKAEEESPLILIPSSPISSSLHKFVKELIHA